MKKILLVLSALGTASALAGFAPLSDPIYITSTNQNEYGIVIRVNDTTPPSESYDIRIEIPVMLKKDKFIDMSLISRDPNSLVTIPIHYTQYKKTTSHSQLKPPIQEPKEDNIARASLCLPKGWLAKCLISIRCESGTYYVELEHFIKKKNDRDQNPDSAESKRGSDDRAKKRETIISFGEVHRYPQGYDIITGPNTAPIVKPKDWKNTNQGVELRVITVEEED
jgi:hypothetical protein